MIEWEQLNRIARERFPDARPTVPMLLAAWAEHDPDGELASVIEPAGLTSTALVGALHGLVDRPSADDSQLMTDCIMSASDEHVTGWHLLKTVCNHPEHHVTRALVDAGLRLSDLRKALEEKKPQPALASLAHHGIAVDSNVSPLLKYGRNLTALAKEEGLFDSYCDRPEELEAMTTILMRMERGNPALTGEAGVGKTALVELLAREVAAGRVGGIAPETRIFEISIGKLVAGTKYRGEFEARIDEIVQAVLKCLPAFLFLDEAHLLFGTGRAEGAPMDMANFLKPFLARGDLRVIAATTADEFNRYIAQDEALGRRFEEIRIPEPDPELTSRMVLSRSRALAKYHSLEIAESVVSRAIELTNEHLPQKLQPYKSIDLVDTASAKARQAGEGVLTEEILLQVLAKTTGRPLSELKGNDRKPLRDLATSLKKRVIGQDVAIDKVVATIVKQRQKLGSAERNLGTFLFVGPTGVGKTEMAKQLASQFYGKDKKILILDMAEYSDWGATNKLIGSPAGFVGSENEGVLIRWLQNNPSGGVLLYDEIEKGHSQIRNLLLGILDNGRIRSARGKVMDCRHCVVVLTSNAITSDDLAKGPLGFGETKRNIDPAELLTKDFPSEFLGRLDDIVLFNALGPDEIRRIVKLRLGEATERMKKRGIMLRCDLDRLAKHLASQLKTSKSGARGVERLVEKKVLDPVALATLRVDDAGELEAEIGDEFYIHGEIHIRST